MRNVALIFTFLWTAAFALKTNPSFVLKNVRLAQSDDVLMNTVPKQRPTHKESIHFILNIRGGSDDNGEESAVMKMVSMFANTVFGTIFAVSRAIEAGIDALQEEGLSPVGRLFNIMTSMVKATFDKNYEVRGKGTHSQKDFSSYLCKAYSIPMSDKDDDTIKIRSGSLSDALTKARSQARLLVIFIPSAKPKKQPNDQKVIKSLMSSDVSEIAERKARKNEEGGSFTFWSSKHDSAESSVAIKRLKAKKGSGKGKNPILMVVYPSQSMNSSGQVKVVPRVLAQHHCNPPPNAESMAKWLNALRKRHAKQYANMQHELKELELFKERTEGYKSSMKDDKKREDEETMKEQRRLEKEKAKEEREQELQQRRESLREELLDEPSQDAHGTITIAIRFSNGSKGQRRFNDEIKMGEVFNWIDATFKIEREIIILTTMNGQRSFSYEESIGLALKDAGLGKMTAFRLSEKVEEDLENDSDCDDEGEAGDENDD